MAHLPEAVAPVEDGTKQQALYIFEATTSFNSEGIFEFLLDRKEDSILESVIGRKKDLHF